MCVCAGVRSPWELGATLGAEGARSRAVCVDYGVDALHIFSTPYREIRADHTRHAWEARGEEQRRAGGGGGEGKSSSSSSSSAPKGWGAPSGKFRHDQPPNPNPKVASSSSYTSSGSSKGKSNLGWDSDEEAFFNKAKVRALGKQLMSPNPNR